MTLFLWHNLLNLNRYSEATHTTAEFLVVEMMRSKYGDNWLYETVNKLKDGGIEKVNAGILACGKSSGREAQGI